MDNFSLKILEMVAFVTLANCRWIFLQGPLKNAQFALLDKTQKPSNGVKTRFLLFPHAILQNEELQRR
jgi:hypothetical protein